MEKEHLEMILEDINGKFDLLLEGHQGLREEVRALSRRTDERFDLVDFKIDTLNRKIDGVDDKLSKKIDGVEEKLTQKIDGVEEKLTQKIDGVEEKLTQKIDGVEEKLTRKIDGVEEKLTQKIDAVDEKLTRKIDGVEASLEKRSMTWRPLCENTVPIPRCIGVTGCGRIESRNVRDWLRRCLSLIGERGAWREESKKRALFDTEQCV